jgi:hypothetical protein
VKNFTAGALVVGVFLSANVVAAGIFLVLGPLAPKDNDTVAVIGMYLIGAIAVACSIFFIVGAMHHIPRWLNTLHRRP